MKDNIKSKDKNPDKNSPQDANFISEGNPNVQVVASIAQDKQSTEVVKQALQDDQSLAPVANDIHVTVKDGEVKLQGKVKTDQQSNLATNTAAALTSIDDVNNELVVKK